MMVHQRPDFDHGVGVDGVGEREVKAEFVDEVRSRGVRQEEVSGFVVGVIFIKSRLC